MDEGGELLKVTACFGEPARQRQLEVVPGLGDALGDAVSFLVGARQVVVRVGVALSCAGLVQLHSALIALREAVKNVELPIRWVHSDAMLAKSLTKGHERWQPDLYFKSGCRWRIVYDA